MLASEHEAHVALPPTSRRTSATSSLPLRISRQSTLETTPSLAPVAMATSLALASRNAANPTMQLRPQRRSPALAAGLALLVAVLLAGVVAGGIAIVPDGFARGPAALYERLRGYVHPDEANVAAASPVMPASPPPEPSPQSHPLAAPPEMPASLTVSSAPPASALPPAPPPSASSITHPVPVVAVDALPKSNVEPNMTLVTLPRSAKGHRIFVDGRVVGSGAAPLKVKCGTRKIRIGSGGKLQVRELPCGGELALD